MKKAKLLLLSLFLSSGLLGQDVIGSIVGGAIGGVVGNQIGGGSGKVASTIAGGVIGSMIGGNSQMREQDNYRERQYYQPQQRSYRHTYSEPSSSRYQTGDVYIERWVYFSDCDCKKRVLMLAEEGQ